MARPLRIEIEDGLYHVTVRGWERRSIVHRDRDRQDWIRLLDRVATRCGWRLFAWVLMTNHFHLFLRTPEPNLSSGMHDLNAGYASLFNRRHRRVGSLYQGRFRAILVENESHSWELSRYVHLNPVRAKMVEHPKDYLWSSYPAYATARAAQAAPAWLDWQTVLGEHAKDMRKARLAYRRFLEAGLRRPPQSPLTSAVGGVFLGTSDWIDQLRASLAKEPVDHNVPARAQLRQRLTSEQVIHVVKQHFKVTEDVLRQPRRHRNEPRIAAIYLLRRLSNEPVHALARQFGDVSDAAVSQIVHRAEALRREDRTWHRLLLKLEKQVRA